MNISVDGGALCGNTTAQFGTYRFTKDCLHALSLYDTTNKYTVYTYCDIDDTRTPDSIRFKPIYPTWGWMKLQIPRHELFAKHDSFLALNQALPLYTPARNIVISHGLSFFLHKEHYKKDYQRLLNQLVRYTHQADEIIVSSRRVQDNLENSDLKIHGRIHVLPFGIPFLFQTYEPRPREPFFLYVGSDQTIKQLPFLLEAFEQFCSYSDFSQFRLVLIGVQKDTPSDKRVECIPHLSGTALKQYYQRASGYLSCSLYESFNYPIVEALSQRCPVVALESAIIPEQRPFVDVVTNTTDFVENMANLARGNKKKYDFNKFEQTFSWKSFVQNLCLLYN